MALKLPPLAVVQAVSAALPARKPLESQQLGRRKEVRRIPL
jgi:hypothetical protein